MKNSKALVNGTSIGRRDFMKVGAVAGVGAAAGVGGALALPVAAQAVDKPSAKVQPWWDARPANAKANKPVAIDLHAHWVPPAYAKAMDALGKPLGNNVDPREMDIEKRLEWMDGHGVQMCVLTLNGGMPWHMVSADDGARLAQIVNDAGAAAHAAHPERFICAAELPTRDFTLALKELNRVSTIKGIKGVHLPDMMEKHEYLFDPGFAPVLARIEELKFPILFHNMNGEPNAYGAMPAGPGLDAAFSHAVECTSFITSGTLDKYPNLEIVLPHAGGTFPFVAGRVEHFMYHMNGKPYNLQHPFRDYLRRFHYDYLSYHPEGLLFMISLLGTDRIVVGTDSFNAKDIEYPSAVVDQFNFPAADRDRILKGNAMRLLGL